MKLEWRWKLASSQVEVCTARELLLHQSGQEANLHTMKSAAIRRGTQRRTRRRSEAIRDTRWHSEALSTSKDNQPTHAVS